MVSNAITKEITGEIKCCELKFLKFTRLELIRDSVHFFPFLCLQAKGAPVCGKLEAWCAANETGWRHAAHLAVFQISLLEKVDFTKKFEMNLKIFFLIASSLSIPGGDTPTKTAEKKSSLESEKKSTPDQHVLQVIRKDAADVAQTIAANGGKCFKQNRPKPAEPPAPPKEKIIENPPPPPPPQPSPNTSQQQQQQQQQQQPPPQTQQSNLPSGFRGKQAGIGSWFRGNHGNDNTNGNSWCGYPYHDNSNVFAPDISIMTDWTNVVSGPAYERAAKAYCGLEALVTNPETGKSKIMYIGDAFDHRYVLNPGAIDIMKGPYEYLTGAPAVDKMKVIRNVQWVLTGQRSQQYCFKCSGR